MTSAIKCDRFKIDYAPVDEIYIYPPDTKPPFSQNKSIRADKQVLELIDELKAKTPLVSIDYDHPLIVVAPAQKQQQPPILPNIPVDIGVDKPRFFQEREDASWHDYIKEGPKKDEGWSEFLRSISEASVETSVVDPTLWDWPSLDDSSDKIRIFAANIRAGGDSMGEGIHFAKLPIKIPLDVEANNGLFIRNEDIGLIKACSKVYKWTGTPLLRSVVLGNPGISKSWHLWKYVVMAANTEVWKAVVSTDDGDFPFQPRVIVFVFGNSSHNPTAKVFFLEDKVVHSFKDMTVASVLNNVADGINVRMLYEPGGSYEVVPHSLINHSKIPCIAALSPLPIRYKEYLKALDLRHPQIMQCPSEEELEAIVRFFVWLGGGGKAELEPRLQEFQARLLEVGPFLRVLIAPKQTYVQYVKDAKDAVKGLSLDKLSQVMRYSIEHTEKTFKKTTHRCARYVTPNAAEGDFVTHYLVPSSTFVLSRLRDELDRMTVENLRIMAMRYQNEVDGDTDNPRALESLTAKYILSSNGLQWQYAVCWSSFTAESGMDTVAVKAESMKCLPVMCKKTEISPKPAPKASEMNPHVLYRPDDSGYPFVDMLWVDEQVDAKAYNDEETDLPAISSVQCSVSPKHAKDLSVYNKLRKSLGMPDRQLLIVYMATIPRSVDGYLLGPVSNFFKCPKKRKAVGSDVGVQVPSNVQFRVLLPEQNMINKTAAACNYEHLLDKIYAEPTCPMPPRRVTSARTGK